MSKSLEALERIGKIDLHSEREDYCYLKNVYVNEYNIIETELKELEDLQKVLDDFGIYNIMNLIDTLKIISFIEKGMAKKSKALEIIKSKKLIIIDKIDGEYVIATKGCVHDLPKEMVDLLKEVLK